MICRLCLRMLGSEPVAIYRGAGVHAHCLKTTITGRIVPKRTEVELQNIPMKEARSAKRKHS